MLQLAGKRWSVRNSATSPVLNDARNVSGALGLKCRLVHAPTPENCAGYACSPKRTPCTIGPCHESGRGWMKGLDHGRADKKVRG